MTGRRTRARALTQAGGGLLLALWASLSAAASPDVPAGAAGNAAVQHDDPRVEAKLLIDASAAQPEASLRVGVLLELDPGWHVYWRNPGQSGLATRLDWKIPDAEIGPIRWPVPQVFREADGFVTTYGYADSVLLASDVRLHAPAGTRVAIEVAADFLVCKVQCIPGRVALARELPVEVRARPADASTHALFERFGERVPVTAESLGVALEAVYSHSAIRPGDAFKAAISAVCGPNDTGRCRALAAATGPADEGFIPDLLPSITLDVTGTRRHPFADGFLVTLAGVAGADAQVEGRLRGVLRLRDDSGESLAVEVDLPFPHAAAGAQTIELSNPWLEPEPPASGPSGVTLWRAILLALAGGLLLNLMPCVLPVLAIKVFGIAERAHSHRRELLAHGAAYTLGILSTLALMAGVVVLLRAAGTAVGWGFQFQEPLFVAAISSVLVVFALNLFDVFAISVDASALSRVGRQASGLRRSFFEGLLAVVVATPCSAPFLGTAVGFAFASPPASILVVFLAIGLGLAAPFVLITLVPGWARLVPRRGAWMQWLRAGLGFALLGTVVWLVWIIGRSGGSQAMTALLVFLLAVGAACWLYGGLQRLRTDGRAPGAALLLVVLGVVALPWLPLASSPAASDSSDGLGGNEFARRFDRAQIARELGQGHPVFVYFTADWCLTCKLNERVVLRDARVVAELAALDVRSFKADWTRPDEGIRAELARHGRAGVPMYLVYDHRRPDQPRVLPELLTVESLVEALRAASHEPNLKENR